MTKLSVHLLGPLQVTLGDAPITDFATDKARALLAYLVVESDRPHRRDALAGLLWPDQSQKNARQNLRQTLARLRQAIDDDRDDEEAEPFLLVSRESIRFNPRSDHWADVAAFTALAEACKNHRHHRRERCASCLRRMDRMAELYRGDFLDQFFLEDSEPFEEWALLTREWLRREAVDALAHLARYHERRGDYARARRYAWQQVALDPWREEAHRQLMRLLALDGQRSAALAQYAACRRALAEELGVEPAAETQALYEAIRAEEQPPPLPRASASPPNLPPSPSPFVGREVELGEIADLLANPDCRLLTIAGPGGIGKTRLALRAAEDQVGLFAHGVVLVPLASVGAPDLLASAIAGALGFPLQGEASPEQQLLNRLRDREMLLLLDGMEHLLAGVPFVVEMLRSVPGSMLLVTSRERLNVREEWVYTLEGLTYPEPDLPQVAIANTLETEAYSAISLFRQRARQANHRFAFSEETARHVVRICRSVEGMPLGVEMAAAWVATRSCEEIAREIERSVDALSTPLRDVPERQRSVRATFDYSWSLLADEERCVFSGLSVFQSGFSGAAACQVVGARPDQLAALVNKSLVRRETPERYGIHELLRQFCAEKLAGSPEEVRLRDAHCRHYAEFLHQREEALQARLDREAPEEVAQELGNVRSAWDWAVAQARWEQVGNSLEGLSQFILIRGPLQAGTRLLEAAEEHLRAWLAGREGTEPEATLLLARLLVAQARFYKVRAMYGRATDICQAAIRLACEVGNETVEAEGLVECAEARWRLGEYEIARRLLEQALAQARTVGRMDIEAESVRHIGNTYFLVGDFDRARGYYERALRICREIGDRLGEASAIYNIGSICTRLGLYAEAKEYTQLDLSIYREIGDRLNEAYVLDNQGENAHLAGDLGEARACYERALHIFCEIGAREGESSALHHLGAFLADVGDYARARVYCERALRIRRESGNRRNEAITLTTLGLISHYLGDDEAALVHCREGLLIAREIGDRVRQGQALACIGRAWLGLSRRAPEVDASLTQAAESFRQALEIRREVGQTHLAFESLAGLADVALARGEAPRALTHVAGMLDALDRTDALSIHLTCYRVLRAARDPRAEDILATAHGLLQEQADKIDNEDLRRSFLEDVAAHREILAAFAKS
jgi:predicted ATPase/DNA-binding SARP family transcriptional activator